MAKRSKQQTKRTTTSRTKPQAVSPSAALTELRKHADQGNPEAQAALRRWLDGNPSAWRKLGDLAHHAQAELVRLVAKGDFLFSESIRRRADELRHEIAGPFPTPMELLLTERIVAAWLQVQYVEAQIALADAEIPTARLWLQRQLQANRLLHAAAKSLTLIRELLPTEGPPAALTANGNSRFAVGLNGNGSASGKAAVNAVSRVNGKVKCDRQRELVQS